MNKMNLEPEPDPGGVIPLLVSSDQIASKKVSKHQSIKPQDELLEIVGLDNLEARVVVPSSWLVWLKKGIEFDLSIDETKTTVKAQVVQIDSVVDPTSQSITLRAKLLKPFENIIPGMSATANFYQQNN